MTTAESVCCALLDCGYLDIQILEDVKYDLSEIVEELQMEGIKVTLNAITDQIFIKAKYSVEEMVDDAIDARELMLEDAEGEEAEKLEEELEELRCLNTDEDIDWFCNCLDTSIWFSDNEEIYRKYLEDEISEVEDNMGFTFG